MYIATIPNRKSPPAILLRESYREKGKVKNRTLANLSSLPPQSIDILRRSLKGEKLVSTDAFEIIEDGSPAHGHVDAVMTAMRRLDFSRLICSRRSRLRDLVVAMVAARILEPRSKLATTAWWCYLRIKMDPPLQIFGPMSELPIWEVCRGFCRF